MIRRHGPLRRVPAILAALCLTACPSLQDDRAELAQSTMIGMPRETLLSCAGRPDRTSATDDLETLIYQRERVVSLVNPAGAGSVGAPTLYRLSCEATFTLRQGRVEQLVYGGDADMSVCTSIVETCLSLAPQAKGAAKPGG